MSIAWLDYVKSFSSVSCSVPWSLMCLGLHFCSTDDWQCELGLVLNSQPNVQGCLSYESVIKYLKYLTAAVVIVILLVLKAEVSWLAPYYSTVESSCSFWNCLFISKLIAPITQGWLPWRGAIWPESWKMSSCLKSSNEWKRHSRQKEQHVQRPRGMRAGDTGKKLTMARTGAVRDGQWADQG